MPIPFILISVALPLAWLVADFRGNASTRRSLGITTLIWFFLVFGFAENLDANAYFTVASKKLLHASVERLRIGKTAAVIQALSRADDKFRWTYESRGKYREIIDSAVSDMDQP